MFSESANTTNASFLDSAPPVILAAAAARTRRIRLTSAVAVPERGGSGALVPAVPTLDLLSEGRAEMVVGRGSSIEAFPLFGYDLKTTTLCLPRSWTSCCMCRPTTRHLVR